MCIDRKLLAMRETIAKLRDGVVPGPPDVVVVAWHSVVANGHDILQCTACASVGTDECPVMKIVLKTECPFPDEPEEGSSQEGSGT